MIVGIQESMTDYPGEMSIIVFTRSCKWNCINCHNKRNYAHTSVSYTTDDVIKYVKRAMPMVTSVTISGGEPTEWIGLTDLVVRLVALGCKVKLDTNGTNPDKLLELLPYLKVVAMDVKTEVDSVEKYGFITKSIDPASDLYNVRRSLDILSNWHDKGGYVILRTTLLDPSIDEVATEKSISQYNRTEYTIQKDII